MTCERNHHDYRATPNRDDQRRNVLVYVDTRYGGQLAQVKRSTARPADAGAEAAGHASIGDLFDAADPQSEADRVLVAAYWLQVVEQAESFEAFPLSRHLKHLGHPVSNITRALGSVIGQTPRLVLQTSKSGRTRQARKRYKLTREGIRRVQAMLDQANGDQDGN